MKGSFKLKYSQSDVLHIYQRSVDKGVIFYTLEDRLVYYTVSACKAKKYGVKVSAAAIMFTHIHQSIQVSSLEVVQKYLHDSDTAFSKMYNNRYHRKGRFFQNRPGVSRKSSAKAIRSNLIYVFNNHVEKGLCQRAEHERWCFLPYSVSENPFSEPLCRKRCGKELRKFLNLVDRRLKKYQNLTYRDLDKILPRLRTQEKAQFVDYIVWKYAWVDFSLSLSMFGSLNALLVAAASTSGGEYDIQEEFSKESDVAYMNLINYAERAGFINKVYSTQFSNLTDMAYEIRKRTGASMSQLRKFFHI